ncbi:YcaO-like family protein [Clavibacter capsici]|uniref:YcaO domain-containing protein n=1 Tax=Clavibacter capsici TaxID=1874630 RepID=A0AAE6XR09_9MICO|nr:YcaO-like family protein [Clavibacter capsici]ALD13439.1 hypothetical protein AES38_11355 [Clavibacter capsici]QIS39778.1 hypothetical protein GW572_11765 [Clavibacter capsici]QIS45637.1 hypothetical protein GW570_11340 [Clavibacter capsici]
MIGIAHATSPAPAGDVGSWTAPSTLVVGSPGADGTADMAELWSRARPAEQADMVRHPDAQRVGGAEVGAVLGSVVRAVADFAVGSGAEGRALWEVDQRSGLTRRAVFDRARDDGASGGRGSSSRTGVLDPTSLRERSLDGWEWEGEGLIDPAAGRLGPAVTDAVEWTTLAPASGATSVQGHRGARRLTWSGQDASFAASRRSAVVEGIERLVGGHQARGGSSTAPAASLGGRAITPLDFDLYPEAAYGVLVERFDARSPHEWVAGTSLVDGGTVMVPRESVYYAQRPEGPRWSLGTSSGCATGSTVEEATVFGLLELVERDTFVNAWYGGIPPVPVVPSTVPGTADMLARVELLGWSTELAALPDEWGIPVFVAAVVASGVRAFGAAAHPDAATAARRALTEAVAYAPDRVREVAARSARVRELRDDPLLVRDLEDHPLLAVPGAHPAYAAVCGDRRDARPLDEVAGEVARGRRPMVPDPRGSADDRAGVPAGEVVEALVGALARTGVETFRVVQTAPFQERLGLTTVMTLAPALSQLDFGWDAQRVRTSSRPERQARLLAPSAATRRRDLPHPFS